MWEVNDEEMVASCKYRRFQRRLGKISIDRWGSALLVTCAVPDIKASFGSFKADLSFAFPDQHIFQACPRQRIDGPDNVWVRVFVKKGACLGGRWLHKASHGETCNARRTNLHNRGAPEARDRADRRADKTGRFLRWASYGSRS